MNTSETQIRQERRVCSRVRTSNSADPYSPGNRIWKLSQLTQEGKSIEVMNNIQMQIRQVQKDGNQPQKPGS
jgi:hypothetical protein